MKSKQRHILLTSLLVTSLLLSACGSNEAAKPTDQTGTVTTTPAPVETVKQSKLTSLEVPKEIVLEPGAKLPFPVVGVMKDGSKADVSHTKGTSYESSESSLVKVDADGTLNVSAQAQTGDTAKITVNLHDQSGVTTIIVKASLQSTSKPGKGDKVVVTNATDRTVVVNKERALPSDYIPADLVYPNVKFSFTEKNDKRKMRSEAAKAIESLFDAAKKDNIELVAISGYRSFATQKSIFARNVKEQGLEVASQVSAREGYSEHQTGLTMDVSSASAKYSLEETFGDTKEGKWLAEHAHEHGFIIRYPKGKEEQTGYAYEPWHIRYVGVEVATEVKEKDMILEQYFQDAIPAQG